MIKHEEIIHITNEEYERINRLLAIESLEDMTEEELDAYGAKLDSTEGLFFLSNLTTEAL